jgi:hypothetical protein
MPKANAELFSLTYGAMVSQIIKDYEEVDKINAQLEKMGYNIGIRLVDELLAKSGLPAGPPCTFREVAEVITKIAFRMFLNISAEVSNWEANDVAFVLAFGENPLTDFVELPTHLHDLKYCNILCGVIRGALEMVMVQVDVSLVADMLRGADRNEIRVENRGAVKLDFNEDYRES